MVCREIGRLRWMHDAAPASVLCLASHVGCCLLGVAAHRALRDLFLFRFFELNVKRQAPGSWHPWDQPASLKLSGYTQGVRSPVDLERRSRRNQGLGAGFLESQDDSLDRMCGFDCNERKRTREMLSASRGVKNQLSNSNLGRWRAHSTQGSEWARGCEAGWFIA
eukprot:3861449-Prymnesium_polylepis.1